jgi:hypothetical protein
MLRPDMKLANCQAVDVKISLALPSRLHPLPRNPIGVKRPEQRIPPKISVKGAGYLALQLQGSRESRGRDLVDRTGSSPLR